MTNIAEISSVSLVRRLSQLSDERLSSRNIDWLSRFVVQSALIRNFLRVVLKVPTTPLMGEPKYRAGESEGEGGGGRGIDEEKAKQKRREQQ